MTEADCTSVAARAYAHIRGRVLQGTYPTGTRLVTRQIAEEIGASLNPVREAIGRLAAEGVIDHIPGAGAVVRAIDPQELLELYELRQAIEPFAARTAADRISEAELDLLRRLCEEQRLLAVDLRRGGQLQDDALRRWHHLEEAFHETLLRAARNRYFERTIANTRVLTRVFHAHRSLRVSIDLRVAARTWLAHTRLVRALAARDGELAAELTVGALRAGLRHVLGSTV